MEEQNKKKTTFWVPPETIQRMDSWLAADNCASRSEFVDKALRFYMGYLASEDTTMFLSDALVATLRGIVGDNENRIRGVMFKQAVELNMMSHTIAAHFRADPIDRRELRAFAIEEVKRTNGQVSFDHALDVQRGFPSAELDDGWAD